MESPATERVTSELTEQFRRAKFDNILKCVHCGLCLDNCPTYRELGDEKDSPRGRLYLMRGLWEGELELNQDVIAPLDRCLDCRACESVCPSGVPYGELLEKTRGILLEHRKQSVKEKLARALLLKGLFRSTAALATASQLLRIYCWTGIPAARTIPTTTRICVARGSIQSSRRHAILGQHSTNSDHISAEPLTTSIRTGCAAKCPSL